MNSTPQICGPRARCRKYATCETCARIRQAIFADRAERASNHMMTPTFYVLVPTDKTPSGIEYARRYFARQARPEAGVWSIESGKHQPGYHLNVIADWCELEGKFKGHIYQEPIRTNVRAVAAYMTKAERAASKAEGFPRQTGDFGHASEWLSKQDYNSQIINAAQLQHEIEPGYLPPSATGPETAHETAKRWLSAIYSIVESQPRSHKKKPDIKTNDKKEH